MAGKVLLLIWYIEQGTQNAGRNVSERHIKRLTDPYLKSGAVSGDQDMQLMRVKALRKVKSTMNVFLRSIHRSIIKEAESPELPRETLALQKVRLSPSSEVILAHSKYSKCQGIRRHRKGQRDLVLGVFKFGAGFEDGGSDEELKMVVLCDCTMAVDESRYEPILEDSTQSEVKVSDPDDTASKRLQLQRARRRKIWGYDHELGWTGERRVDEADKFERPWQDA
ncbi:hypothetical protein BD410DRAFT_804486 [Rickenella mellea]|uniref:Uncharacterized protein n=1 Tax=Rickenella mellea TaxID=50990 RepID=A0A4Y7Q070_9AGAM|nr:hypothetical protein BD410DRAFT_804486 [Rickenella mellea]